MKTTIIYYIVICCYIIGEVYKKIFPKTTYKYIPIVLSIIGSLLGLIVYLYNPKLINDSSIFDAIIIGILSGTSSTGYNQIIKKIIKKE